MNEKPIDPSPALSQATYHDTCDELKRAWASKTRISIEQLLSEQAPGADRNELLVHLVQCEMELRRQAGEDPRAVDYTKRFPEIDPLLVEDLISLPAPPPRSWNAPALPARYEVIEEIGQGGIGSVWRVQDIHLKRVLAAKVLLPKYRTDLAANARLDREALLTGSLQHPGVPAVHDRGQLVSGSSFFTMKLVDGQTLAEILRSRSPEKSESSRLLGIFEQIAQTVAFAHSEGIIHRDLKPQNVMVGRFGEVQIMDWGMAKRLNEEQESMAIPVDSQTSESNQIDQSMQNTLSSGYDSSFIDPMRTLTCHGDVFGTPAYMPPEQARGAVDVMSERSDVFGLGAILFEILTGSRLYDGVPDDQLMQCVKQCDYQSSIDLLENAGIDEELVQICRHCLRESPADRPSNAQAVATIITDHIASVENRLKQAELDRAAAQAAAIEERKRRRAVFIMATAIVAVALIGLAGVAWQWNSAVQSSQLAATENRRARANFENLLNAVERMLTRVGDEKLDQLPYMKTVRRELLQDALAFCEQLLAQEGDSPSLKFEVAEAHRLVGKIQYLLGEYPEATHHNVQAIDLFQSLRGLLPPKQIESPLAFCLESKGRIHRRLGNLAEAEDAYTEAVAIRSQLIENTPGNHEHVISLSDSLRGLGTVKRYRGDLAGAATVLDRAIELLNELVLEDAENREAWLALAASHEAYGGLTDHQGKLEESRSYYQSAVDLLTPLVDASTGADEEIKAELSNYLNNLATVERALGNMEEAEAAHLQAIELRIKLANNFPNTPQYRNLLATSHVNLGVVYKLTNRPAEARARYEDAIELLSELADEFPSVPKFRYSLGITLHNMANYWETTQRNEQAVDLRRQAIDVFSQLTSEFPETPIYQHVSGFAFNDLAIQSERRGRTEEGLAAIDKAIELRAGLVQQFPDNQPYKATLATSRGLKAWILAMQEDATAEHQQLALTLARDAVETAPRVPNNQRALGAAFFRNGRYQDAIEALLKAEPDESDDRSVLYLLAMSYLKAGNREQALEWFDKAEELGQTDDRKPDVNLAPIRAEARQMLENGLGN